VIEPGDIRPRRDSEQERYVVVVSNASHIAMETGRVIVCSFVPGLKSPDGTGNAGVDHILVPFRLPASNYGRVSESMAARKRCVL
jgi:hypothetical protein